MKKLLVLAALAACVAEAKPMRPTIPVLSTANGRNCEMFWQALDTDWGYKDANGQNLDRRNVYIVQHPVAAKDKPGAPMLVVLHSSGQSAAAALLTTIEQDNHDIFKSPDDFYALYLDCRTNRDLDWWWGYDNCHGFAISPCEKRLLDTIEQVVVKYGINRDRIYLCGNSMGASGVLGFGLRNGNLFAAIKANVPALAEHACDRMGWGKAAEQVPAGFKFADPPILVNHTAPNDMKWSTGQENLIKMMHDRKYAFMDFWADHKHCNKNSIILAAVDIVHSFDWLHVKKSSIYPVFTDASCDTKSPWPDNRDAKGAGQINGFFRWDEGSDTATSAQIALYVADLKTKHFTVPEEATAAVTLRRLKNLKPVPGQLYKWTFGEQSGTAITDAEGLVTVPGLKIARAKKTLTLELTK